MPFTLESCKKLFAGYLLNQEAPLRINLPKDLVYQLVEKYFVREKLDFAERSKITNLLDFSWYSKRAYQEHPYSERSRLKARLAFEEEFEQWRGKVPETKSAQVLPPCSSVKAIFEMAAAAGLPVTVGEDHRQFTPKAILMAHLPFLKEKKALLLMEGLRKELQKEFDQSAQQKKLSFLAEVYLSGNDSLAREPLYSREALVRGCLEQGIPIVACESWLSLECAKIEGFFGAFQLSIKRMLQNFEHFKTLHYAKTQFPEHLWHLSLVGDHHAYTFKESGPQASAEEVYPSIVDIMGGIYLCAEDGDQVGKTQKAVAYLEVFSAKEQVSLFPSYTGKARPGYRVQADSLMMLRLQEDAPGLPLVEADLAILARILKETVHFFDGFGRAAAQQFSFFKQKAKLPSALDAACTPLEEQKRLPRVPKKPLPTFSAKLPSGVVKLGSFGSFAQLVVNESFREQREEELFVEGVRPQKSGRFGF